MKNIFKSYIVPIFLGILLAHVIKFYVLETNKVVGESMLPTFEDGDFLISEKISYKITEPKINDIVIVKVRNHEGEEISVIKRVVGLPNDKIKLTSEGLFRNGEHIEEEYILEDMVILKEKEYIVGKNEIFVLGDNRHNSSDSRIYGNINFENINGKVLIKLFNLK